MDIELTGILCANCTHDLAWHHTNGNCKNACHCGGFVYKLELDCTKALRAEVARLTAELAAAREERDRLKSDAAQFWDDWLHLSQQIGDIEDAIVGLDEWGNASLEDFEEFDPWWPVQQAARLLKEQNLYAEYYEQHIRYSSATEEESSEFLEKTKDVEEHPVWWEWHCLCQTCQDDGTR